MAIREKEIYMLDLVVLGNFNPVIINSLWLINKGLIRESEVIKTEIIHPQISRFELAWVSIEVVNDRIDFKCKRESDFNLVKDLVLSIFTLLKETPIKAFGFNHLYHYQLNNSKEYADFGYWLSPVLEFKDFLNTPKLLNVSFNESEEIEGKGRFILTISPSDLIKDNGVVFNVNHHIECKNKDNSKDFINSLNLIWDYSFEKVENINSGVWQKSKI